MTQDKGYIWEQAQEQQCRHTHMLSWRRRAKKQWSFTAQEGV